MGCSFYSSPVESTQYSAGHDSGVPCTAASNGARGYIVLGALSQRVCQPELVDSAGVQEAEEGGATLG